MKKIRMIAGVSTNGVIGIYDDSTSTHKLPWKYSEDMKFFKAMTTEDPDPTVVMGRITFESMGSKPLPKRKNIVVSSKEIQHPDVLTCRTLQEAIDKGTTNTWLIGGASIYKEGMNYCESIHLGIIPEVIEGNNLIMFPFINPADFTVINKRYEVCSNKKIYTMINMFKFLYTEEYLAEKANLSKSLFVK